MHRITSWFPSSSRLQLALFVSFQTLPLSFSLFHTHTHTFSQTYNRAGVIIHGYTDAIISNRTLHPLDPPHFLSIYLFKLCNCGPRRYFLFCVCANLLRGSDEDSHTQLPLNRICTPSHLQRGGGPSDIHHKHKQLSRDRCAHPPRTTRTSQNRFPFPNISCDWAQIMTNKSREKKRERRGREGREESEAQRGLEPDRGREIEFHMGK